ncbi:serine/arginine repetitive matrix protein 2-like isoform X2 [Ischnura elegans]|nr:serine/arginine repetitive matrix protein 2-like isoform X2 [Ischnura elegans]
MADDSDEEDLEALRLAALQSIKSKPTVVVPRRRPKLAGRPNRNFFRGSVNPNLISIVPVENPLEKSEPAKKVKSDDPPPLVLPQHRYCKTEVKTEKAEEKPQVSTKFSRFEDSNSGDSDDDYDDEFDEKSSDSDHACETAEKAVKAEPDDADDDELLLQDEDSLGKFFNEIDDVPEEKNNTESPVKKEKVRPSGVKTTQSSGNLKKPIVKKELGSLEDSSSGLKSVMSDRSSVSKVVVNKTDNLNMRESGVSVKTKVEDNKVLKEGSPLKKAVKASVEDDKRINRPCVMGRNRSPSPTRGKLQDRGEVSPILSRKKNDSPVRRKPSPPSPGSLSPLCKTQLSQLPVGKQPHPPRSLPSRNSPQDMTPPSYWGSQSNSNHGYPHGVSSREWSSSPRKWSGPQVPGSLSDPPRHLAPKNISPPRQRRSSKSPFRGVSRVRRSSDRDWSTSPPRRRYKDFDTPPDSLRSSNDGRKSSRRRSLSPVRLGDRSRYAGKMSEVPLSGRFSPDKKSLRRSRSRSPRFSPPKKNSHRSRSRSPRYSPVFRSSHRSRSRSPRFPPTSKSSLRSHSRSPRFSPVRKRSCSPRLSPVRKRSRSPRISPLRKRSRSRSFSPVRKRSRSPRLSPIRKRSRSPRISPARRRSRSPRFSPVRKRSRSPRFSPLRKDSRSPLKTRRSLSPARSLSRTPSLSPSPDREGKSAAGNYRRHKSPLRLPGFRPPRPQDGRTFRPDGKVNRKDSDRRVKRLNGPSRKMVDSRQEVSKIRPLSTKSEDKSSEPVSEEKVDSLDKEVDKSPVNIPPPSSWSSEDDGESDSESRFKGTDSKAVQPSVTPPKPVQSALLRVKDLKELVSPDKTSPKKKKNKRNKKMLSKTKALDNSPEPQSKRLNEVDLRAELSRRRAERVNKSKGTNSDVPVRLVQSALQSIGSKPNSLDSERSTLKSYAAKSDAGTELMISKKKPIHLRLGLPVARNPDPPELTSSAGSLLPRISGLDNADSDPGAEGGNSKWRKVKLKRSVTVEKSQSRGTPTTNNASGKEQVMSVSQLMLLILAGVWCGHRRRLGPSSSSSPLPYLSPHSDDVSKSLSSPLLSGQEKSCQKNTGDSILGCPVTNFSCSVNFYIVGIKKYLYLPSGKLTKKNSSFHHNLTRVYLEYKN